MTCYKIKKLKILCCCLIIWFIILTMLIQFVSSSEFPERECCDITPTTTINSLPIPPAALPTDKTDKESTQSSIQIINVGRSGSNIKVASAILNCILARQLCFEDSSCSAILEIIPRVCGPIPVSCSTVTVTKCQAALRTLQAFQFFRPTCLCKEPGMDPDCNHFRDFLFDHPCGFVLKKAEKDPYPIDALPTCNHALSVCQQERKCLKLFEDFKTHCKVRDNKCKMESRDACHDAWTNLRLSPMFGCICPNNHMKKRCDRIFNVVNHNPCVDRLIFFLSGLTPKVKQRFEQKQSNHQKNRLKGLQRYFRKNNTAPKSKYYEQQQKQHQLYNYNGSDNKSKIQNEENAAIYHQQKSPKLMVGDNKNLMMNSTEDNNENGSNRDIHNKNYNEKDNEDYDDYDDHIRAEIYSNYPHYLHPPSWGLNNPLVLASRSPHTYNKPNNDLIIDILSGEIDTSSEQRKYWLDQHKSEEKESSPWSPYFSNTQSHYPKQHQDDHKIEDVVVIVDTHNKNTMSLDLGTVTTAKLDKNNLNHIQRQTYYTHNNDEYRKRYAEYKHNADDDNDNDNDDDDVIFIVFDNKTNSSPKTKTTNVTTEIDITTNVIYDNSTASPKINRQQYNFTVTMKNNLTTGSDDLTAHRNANNKNYFKSQGLTYDGLTINERVKAMGMDAKLHQKLFEDNLALIDTPLIVTNNIHYHGLGTVNYNVNGNNNGYYYHHTQQGVLTYPYNISEFLHRHMPTHESPLDNISTGGQDLEADLSTETIKQHFQSTCHTALTTCREDPSCLSSLQPMLTHCEIHQCNRNECMTSLQLFYKSPHEDLNLDIAFCLCKKTPNRQDACMVAQEKLHPICAQQPTDIQQQEYALPPLCHAVAEVCKENRECRLKLEYYEQACAVDSVTKKCAGRPSGCRIAVVGILGTMLRTTCTCQGADLQFLYHCIGWRRLLWMNPCVVEAQKDFHMKRLTEMGLLTTSTITATTTTTTSTHVTTIVKATSHTPLPNGSLFTPFIEDGRKLPNHVHMPKKKSQLTLMEHNSNEELSYGRSYENENNGNEDYYNTNFNNKRKYNNNSDDSSHNFISSLSNRSNNEGNNKQFYNIGTSGTTSPILSTTVNTVNGKAIITKSNGSGIHYGNNLNDNDESIRSVIVNLDDQMVYVEATEFVSTDIPITLIIPNTTTTITTIITTTPESKPPRSCVVQRPQQADQLIRESTSKRIYTLEDAECSELCSCGESLTLTCHALCVPFSPCRTALAFYSHASPAYQAFRGRCLCYSGRFICMKPPLGEYTLPGGLFLMLGYSSADEALLRPHTNLGVQDAVRVLQQYITSYVDNQTQCTLTLFNMTDENLIIAARLPHDLKMKTVELLHKEKDECITILKTIAHHINSEHHELQSHRLLSIFKLAEVEIVWPETNQTIQLYNNYKTYIILMLISLLLSQPIVPIIGNWKLKFDNKKNSINIKQKNAEQIEQRNQQQIGAFAT